MLAPSAAIAAAPSARAGSPGRSTHATTAAKTPSPSLRTVKVRPLAAGDEVVTGRGDVDGWHLYAASSGAPGGWQPLATLAPAPLNAGGERWIGRQCITGDGRYVVAVVAPWSANNTPAGMDRGGIAYVVDAHTGAVRPLVTGVSLHYFTPSCGSGSTVALTRFTGTDEQTTQLVDADAASAEVTSVQTVSGELTGAVPAPDGGVFAARGDTIVHVAHGRESVRARIHGQPFALVANAAGGVDFLVGKDKSATVWSLEGNGPRQVGTGDFGKLALFTGRGGHTVAAGTTHLDPSADLKALPRTVAAPEAVSLDATLLAAAPASATDTATTAGGSQLLTLPLLLDRPGSTAKPWTPVTAAPPVATVPSFLTDTGVLVAAPAATPSTAKASRRSIDAARPMTASSPPYQSKCAVGRNNVYLQAMQPSPEDVDWAANLAGRGELVGASGQFLRPANYANLNGASGKSIPREVLEGIFAQESNFNQATWHSVQGVAGNPLIADYYAAGGGYVVGAVTDSTGQPNPDCGYGLGQITTGMRTGQMSYDLQRKVAADYAEGAAAAAQILSQKWNELENAGITAGDNDPSELEAWYLAVWDYNSGLHANTGSGPWGLGWTNNPANPAYPYNRHPFLHQDNLSGPPTVTYGDAATPGNWPYQEKVFGWMEVPLKNSGTGHASYIGLIQSYDSLTGNDQVNAPWIELARPGQNDFCSTSSDQCDPTVCSRSMYAGNCNPATTDGTGPCTRSDYECWWHYADNWCSLASLCHTGTWEYSPGAAEPPAADANFYPKPVCSVSGSDIPAGTTIVDSQASDVNLQGCTSANTNWHSSGSFAFTYGDPNDPAAQATDMDLHQLGAGLGGHIWFTHTNEPTDSTGESLWGITGTWTPNLADGRYEVKVFVPNTGATATEANYAVNNGLGLAHTVTVNQNASTGWVSLGKFWLGPGATVSLTNLGVTSSGDLAFSGIAFTPTDSGNYAMLGDSYSSGEGARTYDAKTSNYATTCPPPNTNCTNNGHRSPLSYNRVFAASTTTFGKSTDPTSTDPAKNWSDAACSGAVIADFYATNQQGNCPNEPGQMGALNADTSLVTLTFGGNDLGFTPVIQSCVFPILGRGNCQAQWDTKIRADIQSLADPSNSAGWPQLFQKIKSLAPNAEVVALGYPHLVTGNSYCMSNGYIGGSDQAWLNQIGDLIDQTLATTAKAYGVDYLSTTPIFAGHELCTPNSSFTGILDPNPNDTEAGGLNFVQNDSRTDTQQFFHPNAAGYAAEAAALKQILPIP